MEVETLDHYVEKALDFIEANSQEMSLPKSRHTLVVGSQNGCLAGRIMYKESGRIFSHAKEVSARHEIDSKKDILDDVTIVSATGSRNVVSIAEHAIESGLAVNLICCRENSEVAGACDVNEMIIPSLDEPPTINTCTYGAMINSVTGEDIGAIRKAVGMIKENYSQYEAFTILLPDSQPEVAEMVDWKLNGEIFGRKIPSMCANYTNFMHGAGVIQGEKELFASIGVSNEYFGKNREQISVPDSFGPLGYMMAGYYLVGKFQKNDSSFQDRIMQYKEETKSWKWAKF